VRPRSATIVEEGGVFLSNYVCMQPVGTLQTYPVAHLIGERATARFNSILVAPPGSDMDVGARVFLKAKYYHRREDHCQGSYNRGSPGNKGPS